MVSACSSGTLTNVLPHRNAMPKSQDMTPNPVTVYRHKADLSLCYPLMRNVTMEPNFCMRLLTIASDVTESCRVRGTIVSCETNLRQSGGIGANRMKKSRRVRGVSHDTIFSPDSITQNPCLVPFKSDQQHF